MENKYLYGYSKADYKKFSSFAWRVLLSFGLMYMFFYNGRQNINLVKDAMASDLGTTTAGISAGIGMALFWCYAFGQLINGRLGAIVGYKRYMALGVLISSVLNVLISFAHSIPVIAVLWGLNGFAQSMVWSNGLGVLNKWWPKKNRGFASGLATSFSGVGQVVTYISVSVCLVMNPEWGWRAAFRFPIVPLVIALVAFVFLFKEKPEDADLAPFEEEDREAEARDIALCAEIEKKGFLYPYKVLFSEPKVIVFCLISAIAGVGRYGLLSWMPTYFKEAQNMDIKSAIFSSILLPIGQACAMFIFPLITDKIFKGKREPMLALASVVTFIGLVLFPFVKNQALASFLLFLLGVFGMVTGVIWAVAGDMGGRAFAATVVGILDWAVYMGAAVQEGAFGYLKDNFGWPAIFVTIGALYIVMLMLTLAARKMKMKKL